MKRDDNMELYKRDLWLNPNILFAFNKSITEYDIKEAGFSLTREFELLPKKKIESLMKLSKDARKRALGVIQRDNAEYKEQLKKAFKEARRVFMETNELDESNIISIKKDAIFSTSLCNSTEFGEIKFVPKNVYSCYMRFPNGKEVYYSKNKIDVKGIDDDVWHVHDNYIINFISTVCEMYMSESKSELLRFIRRFVDKYKKMILPLGYYREFNERSKYILKDETSNTVFDEYWDDKIDELDIGYNYFNVIIPLLKMVV